MKRDILTSEPSKRMQMKQVMNNDITKISKISKNKISKKMTKNIRAVDSEAFKILSALNSVSGMNNPLLEFEQVKRGIFKSKNLKNIQLEITDESFQRSKDDTVDGSMMHIIDLRTDTKVVSKFLKSYTLMQKYNKKNPENSAEYPITKNLRLEDFQPKKYSQKTYLHDNHNLPVYYFLSANFKLSSEKDFSCSFSIEENKIQWKAETLFPGIPANEVSKKTIQKWLFDFKAEYYRRYKENIDLNNNPYLSF